MASSKRQPNISTTTLALIRIRLYLWWKKVLFPCLLVDFIYNFGEIYYFFPDDVNNQHCWFIWVKDRAMYSATTAYNVKNLLIEITSILIALVGWIIFKDKNLEQHRETYKNIFKLFVVYGILELPYYFANHKTDYYQTIYIIVFFLQWYWNRKELIVSK